MRSALIFVFILSLTSIASAEDRSEAARLNARGWTELRAGKPVAAAKLFDEAVEAAPSLKPRNWQRGIALYYAGRYEDGAKQFEVHQTANPQDVENTVWHLLCLTRVKDGSLAKARKKLLPVNADRRVPMAEIYDLFAGSGSVEAVDTAADESGGLTARFYADLYVGLYLEATGDADGARKRIDAAVDAPLRGGAMHDVAVAHQRIRAEGR